MKRILFLLPFLLCLSSCWDYTEPSAQNYVLGMSVDYAEDRYIVSIETVKITGEPTSLSASEGVITQGEGKNLFDAVKSATAKAGKTLYWGHMELIILGEEVAKHHLYTVSDAISRWPEVYSNVDLAVSRGCLASEILTAKTPQDMMASVHIANIFENEISSRRFDCCTLWQLRKASPYILIPSIHLQDGPVVEGCAIFSSGVYQGYLSGDEIQVFTLVEENKPGGDMPDISIDNTSLSIEILEVKSKKSKDTCRVHIAIALSNSSAPFDTVSPENCKMLEAKTASLISKQIDLLMTKPFGNLLSYDRYDIQVSLESSGLIKR